MDPVSCNACLHTSDPDDGVLKDEELGYEIYQHDTSFRK